MMDLASLLAAAVRTMAPMAPPSGIDPMPPPRMPQGYIDPMPPPRMPQGYIDPMPPPRMPQGYIDPMPPPRMPQGYIDPSIPLSPPSGINPMAPPMAQGQPYLPGRTRMPFDIPLPPAPPPQATPASLRGNMPSVPTDYEKLKNIERGMEPPPQPPFMPGNIGGMLKGMDSLYNFRDLLLRPRVDPDAQAAPTPRTYGRGQLI